MLREVGRKATFYMLKYVKNNCKGWKNMDNTRRIYLDNIRWITVCIVVIYHVIYMYNGVQLIIPGISEPPARTLRATVPENERHIFR